MMKKNEFGFYTFFRVELSDTSFGFRTYRSFDKAYYLGRRWMNACRKRSSSIEGFRIYKCNYDDRGVCVSSCLRCVYWCL